MKDLLDLMIFGAPSVALLFVVTHYFKPFGWVGRLLRSRQRKELIQLREERRRHVAALEMYADPKHWIGSEFHGSEDVTGPAQLALEGHDAEQAIRKLPPGRFAARKP